MGINPGGTSIQRQAVSPFGGAYNTPMAKMDV